MSTQRMENRSTPATYSTRGVSWDISKPEAGHGFRRTRYASRPEGRLECDGFAKTPVAQVEIAHATGNSAPPVQLASFHEESGRNFSAIGFERHTIRWNVPQPVAPRGSTRGSIAAFISREFSESNHPSGPARFHPSLPRVPAALSCRTER